ncbi:MAG: hypothetical protein IT312_08655 [Anaerolineales bacterium]|nr:hypothetical protein [Anaerolineales bacterium]
MLPLNLVLLSAPLPPPLRFGAASPSPRNRRGLIDTKAARAGECGSS